MKNGLRFALVPLVAHGAPVATIASVAKLHLLPVLHPLHGQAPLHANALEVSIQVGSGQIAALEVSCSKG